MMMMIFLCKKKILARLKQETMFCYENGLTFPIYASDKKLENSMDLLHVIDDDKLHYVYIKDFDRFMFYKTKITNKKHFCKNCLLCFSSKNCVDRT